VELRGLRVSAIIGILPRERITPQAIDIDLSMALDLTYAGDTGDLAASIDYAAVAQQVRFLAVHGKFRLLESLGLAVVRLLLLPPGAGEQRAPIVWVRVEMAKPHILGANPVPVVVIERDVADVHVKTQTMGPNIVVQTCVSVPETTVARLEFSALDRFSLSPESVLPLGGEVTYGGTQLTGPSRCGGDLAAQGPASVLLVTHP
jgi:dihydroneopterin aldolase